MINILTEEKAFLSQIEDIIDRVEKNGKIILTKFLSMREQAIIREVIKYRDVLVEFNGGYGNAERCRALFYPSELNIEHEFNIVCLKIVYNKRYLKITHQNVLGTLMSFQLDRALYGDIVFDGDDCYFFLSNEIENVLMMDFIAINKVPISLIPYNQKLDIEQKYLLKEIIISSMRIDNLISHVYNLSRDVAKKLIESNNVYRNFQIIENPDAKCMVDDIISVRRHGRFIISQILRKTKSDKIVVEIKIPT